MHILHTLLIFPTNLETNDFSFCIQDFKTPSASVLKLKEASFTRQSLITIKFPSFLHQVNCIFCSANSGLWKSEFSLFARVHFGSFPSVHRPAAAQVNNSGFTFGGSNVGLSSDSPAARKIGESEDSAVSDRMSVNLQLFQGKLESK